jgi:hypothetical protein
MPTDDPPDSRRDAQPQKMLPPLLITKDGRSAIEHLTNPKRRKVTESSLAGLETLDE